MISARYAGEPCDDEANNDKVIAEMKEVEEVDRDCRFRCVLALLEKVWKRPFPVPVRAPCSSSEEGAEASATTHSFCPMRASPPLLKFPSRKRLRLATVHGLYLS